MKPELESIFQGTGMVQCGECHTDTFLEKLGVVDGMPHDEALNRILGHANPEDRPRLAEAAKR